MAGVVAKSCFVVCPIGGEGTSTRRHADWLLHEIINHVFDHNFPGQFSVTRSDTIDTPGMIDAQIINHLLDDDLVIADMSELNANAFYEMGIRHMKELPVIHMFKKGETIPFDVKLYRAIPFDYNDPTDLKAARSALSAAVRAVFDPNYKPDNPVIRARGVPALPETTMAPIEFIQQQIDDLADRLNSVEEAQDEDFVRVRQPVRQVAAEIFVYLTNMTVSGSKTALLVIQKNVMAQFPNVEFSQTGLEFRITIYGNHDADAITALGSSLKALPYVESVKLHRQTSIFD